MNSLGVFNYLLLWKAILMGILLAGNKNSSSGKLYFTAKNYVFLATHHDICLGPLIHEDLLKYVK